MSRPPPLHPPPSLPPPSIPLPSNPSGSQRVNSNPNSIGLRQIRVLASGTVFHTHNLTLPSFPAESAIARARTVTRTRGGSAANVLATLGQLPGVKGWEGVGQEVDENDSSEGAALVRELKREGVDTRYCRFWEGASVPSAWVLEAEDNGSKTVINHNPLPDVTHEEFVSLLGPLLVPENFEIGHREGSGPNVSGSSGISPFEWMHFEGRSVKTTLSNIIGIDGLAKERKWRSNCVFSLDATKIRQGIEALIPHSDVIFFSKQYALSQNTAYTSPRPFLLSLASSGRVSPHALLIAYWGKAGAALLSVPTREYLQSSGWVDDSPDEKAMRPLSTISTDAGVSGIGMTDVNAIGAIGSVRSGSGFWAAGHRAGSGTSSSAYTFTGFSAALSSTQSHSGYEEGGGVRDSYGMSEIPEGAEDEGENDTETGREKKGGKGGKDGEGEDDDDDRDELAAQDAFIAGMIFALSQRIVPGPPYAPNTAPYAQMYNSGLGLDDRGKWRLEDCLRFASELSGRRARKKVLYGLGDEIRQSGWFD
ncbi:hypothetical protein PNOK_0014500 [Pyrrhoderma noxium]|uniref:Carbohydrate kinase PfkB domain-containing protein n=1 Tax=Pyrrhoderma noxium TaxID=2282107 RepID=A0A286UU24_9AGAM|nr:hypothetical protein PNOK_0014500 [Pyrrhoderma noxium]